MNNFVKDDKVTMVTAYRDGGNREIEELVEENTSSMLVIHIPSPLSPLSPLSPHQPSKEVKKEELKQSSSLPLINNSLKDKRSIIDDRLEEIKDLSHSFSVSYKDVLSVLEEAKNPQTKELIIYNAKNIKRVSDRSDKFVCSLHCRYSDDKWGMLKHPCKNFYNNRKKL